MAHVCTLTRCIPSSQLQLRRSIPLAARLPAVCQPVRWRRRLLRRRLCASPAERFRHRVGSTAASSSRVSAAAHSPSVYRPPHGQRRLPTRRRGRLHCRRTACSSETVAHCSGQAGGKLGLRLAGRCHRPRKLRRCPEFNLVPYDWGKPCRRRPRHSVVPRRRLCLGRPAAGSDTGASSRWLGAVGDGVPTAGRSCSARILYASLQPTAGRRCCVCAGDA